MGKRQRKIPIHIFVYYKDEDEAPTYVDITKGWRAEVISNLPNAEFVCSGYCRSQDAAISQVMKRLSTLGYSGEAEIFTMEYIS